jgi:hypothetical protein
MLPLHQRRVVRHARVELASSRWQRPIIADRPMTRVVDAYRSPTLPTRQVGAVGCEPTTVRMAGAAPAVSAFQARRDGYLPYILRRSGGTTYSTTGRRLPRSEYAVVTALSGRRRTVAHRSDPSSRGILVPAIEVHQGLEPCPALYESAAPPLAPEDHYGPLLPPCSRRKPRRPWSPMQGSNPHSMLTKQLRYRYTNEAGC